MRFGLTKKGLRENGGPAFGSANTLANLAIWYHGTTDMVRLGISLIYYIFIYYLFIYSIVYFACELFSKAISGVFLSSSIYFIIYTDKCTKI